MPSGQRINSGEINGETHPPIYFAYVSFKNIVCPLIYCHANFATFSPSCFTSAAKPTYFIPLTSSSFYKFILYTRLYGHGVDAGRASFVFPPFSSCPYFVPRPPTSFYDRHFSILYAVTPRVASRTVQQSPTVLVSYFKE